MSLENQVRSVLKTILKRKGFSYASLSKDLGVSEITVKRLFTKRSISLSDMEAICSILNVSPEDVLTLAQKDTSDLDQLSLEQERFLCSNPVIDYLFLRLIAGFKAEDIQSELDLDSETLDSHLKSLESQGLVKKTSSGRVTVTKRGPFRWQKNGSFEHKYRNIFFDEVYGDLMSRKPMDSENESFLAFEMYLSKENLKTLNRDLKELVEKYRKNSRLDHVVNEPAELVPSNLLIGTSISNTWKRILIDKQVLPIS